MKTPDKTRSLLQHSLPPVPADAAPAHDLWPNLRQRIHSDSVSVPRLVPIPLFDWVVLAGLAAMAFFVPASIPVLLYCF
jgi:hypothetical protein